jgi:hypothetical protein
VLGCYTGRAPEELAEREAARSAGPALDAVHFGADVLAAHHLAAPTG